MGLIWALVGFSPGSSAWQLWFVLAAVLTIAEAITVMLVSVWFVIGALIAGVAALCGASLVLQIILFVAVSLICLAVGWHFRDRLLMQKHKIPTNADRLLGQPGQVEEAVDLLQNTGRVHLKGQSWRAVSADPNQPIAKGTIVTVLGIKGASLVVAPQAQAKNKSQDKPTTAKMGPADEP